MAADYPLIVGIALNLAGAVLVGTTKMRFQAEAYFPGGGVFNWEAVPTRTPDVSVTATGFARPCQWWGGWGLIALGNLGQLLSALGVRLF